MGTQSKKSKFESNIKVIHAHTQTSNIKENCHKKG